MKGGRYMQMVSSMNEPQCVLIERMDGGGEGRGGSILQE